MDCALQMQCHAAYEVLLHVALSVHDAVIAHRAHAVGMR